MALLPISSRVKGSYSSKSNIAHLRYLYTGDFFFFFSSLEAEEKITKQIFKDQM